MRRADGKGGGAIVGFANYLIRFWQAEQPRAVLAAWDTLSVPNWRQKLFAPYQGGRVFERDIVEQLDRLPELVAACGFANAKGAGYEADDFLAAAVQGRGGARRHAWSWRAATATPSSSPPTATTIVHPLRAGEVARIGPAEVRERYGVEPGQVPDFIALRGDPSDKIPGARGMGPKGAATLLSQYPTLEAALADGRFAGQADDLRLYLRIATMDAAAPLPPLPDMRPDLGEGRGARPRLGPQGARRPARRARLRRSRLDQGAERAGIGLRRRRREGADLGRDDAERGERLDQLHRRRDAVDHRHAELGRKVRRRGRPCRRSRARSPRRGRRGARAAISAAMRRRASECGVLEFEHRHVGGAHPGAARRKAVADEIVLERAGSSATAW